MFHVDGYHHLLSSSLPASGNNSMNPSRSNTPPMNEGFPPTNYPTEHLAAFTEMLANGISTSNEVKKKDNHGKTYRNCFTGKEAVNCLRPRLPKGAMVSQECMSLLQQMLTEGFILEAQSVEDLNKQIAAKFIDKDKTISSARNSPKLQAHSLRSDSPKLAAHSLAFKVPTDIGGVIPAPLIFRKDALYQLSTMSTANAILPPSFSPQLSSCSSPPPSGYTSPIPSSGTGLVRWYENYSGVLGKKRENKGLGNSLALGLGVSTFQKRFFLCSAKEQAVVYYKEEPVNGGAGVEQERPLGFIPFSEILFVDHLQSSTNQLTSESKVTSPTLSRGNSKQSSPQMSRSNSFKNLSGVGANGGASTPPVMDDKAGRLFDIVASFRVYHLQAESTMEAMKWVQAIKESIKEAYLHRSERLASNGGAIPQQQLAIGPGGTMKAPLVRTPRTPEHSKRFWSNHTHSSVNPGTFPEQRLKQVLRDERREELNGLYGRKIKPMRVSDLRRHFFELNFSISSLNQPSSMDQLVGDFHSDAQIVELAWNVVMKGVVEAEATGPKSFRSNVEMHTNGAPFVSPLNQPILVPTSSFTSGGGATQQYVDTTSSTLLLAKMNEDACDEDDDDDVDLSSSLFPPRRRPLRSLSCSFLPDTLGRRKPKRVAPRREEEILKPREESRAEYSRSTSSSTSTRSNGVRTKKRTHRRHHSDLCPLSSAMASKHSDFSYHLLNKYALYHSAACKLPKAGTPAALEPTNLLNAPFLYRIYHPYKRLESWLHTDAFLTLVLNDEALINEVPLALPLVWAILQWRNHDSDPHSGSAGGSGFVDDSCLRKNWMEETVDGEDDGFTGAQGASEEEESTLVASKENAVKAGFKSVSRAHLRVNSFSTMADPLSAIRSVQSPPTGSPTPQSPPVCPTSPVVYGQHGQIVAGMGARGSMVGSHHHHAMIGAGATSPGSPNYSDFYNPDQSPLSPMTPLMTFQPPGIVRSLSSPGEEMTASPPSNRSLPPRAPMTTPPFRPAPGTPTLSPFPISRQWPGAGAGNEDEPSISRSDEPGAARGQRNSGSELEQQSEVGSMVHFNGSSAPSTRRNSFVGSSKRSSAGLADFTPTVSFATASVTVPSSKRNSLEPGQGMFTRTAPASGASSPMRRERGTIIQTGQTIRPPNLLTGAGNYQTLRGSAPVAPTIPLELPHWKVRSLVACKYCFQSSLEFMQAIQERYGMDAGKEEHARACKAAMAAGKRPPQAHPESKFTISVANTLFSLLLTPLYTLPSLSSSDYSANNNPVLQDSFNVLGKCIVSPHIWPTLLACLQSNQATCSDSTAPFLKHHVLKDLNTLFIGSNLSCNNRNCKLLFKFFTHISRKEFKLFADAWTEAQKEKKMSEREREKAERRRRRAGGAQITIGAWQKGLLNLLKNHVPMRGGHYPSIRDPGIERLHSKIYQYTLNLFGVFHFYKFQCIGAATTPLNVHLPANSKAALAAEDKALLMTSCSDFEKLFKESFWRAMHLHRQAYAEQQRVDAENSTSASGEREESASTSKNDDQRPASNSTSKSSNGSHRSSIDMRHLDHTVARSMLTTMLQRLIFKIKSKTCNLEQRWPAVAFLLQQVKSFVFSTPFKAAPGVGTPVPPTPAGTLTREAILGFELDFAPGSESLHNTALPDDVDLLEKALELIRSLRLYQELDLDLVSLQKQKEIKLHVEKESHSNKGRMIDLNDPSSKLVLNSAHEDLMSLYHNLIPSDQSSLRFLQQSVSFLKDSVCFLNMMQQPRAHHMDAKEVHTLVQRFVTMERREKVFCNTK
jgi:hypothetical protein